MSKPVCAITGATGAVGPMVAAAFEAEGYAVRALSRRDADVGDRDALRRLFDGAQCVVHLAALLHVNNPPPEMNEAYRRINVGGTENVVRAAEGAGVQRLVYFSTINVYGPSLGRMLTEETEPRPETIYAETKLAGERIALAAPFATVLRLAAVYGAGIKGNYRRLLLAMNRGRFISLGNGMNRRTLVYDRDVGRAAVLAARHERAAGEVFNVTDGAIHVVRDILEAMALALDRRPPRLSLPVAPVRFGIGAVETLFRAVRRRPPVSRALLDKYLEEIAVDGSKLRNRLGFAPAYDLRRGWRETVELMRARGEL